MERDGMVSSAKELASIFDGLSNHLVLPARCLGAFTSRWSDTLMILLTTPTMLALAERPSCIHSTC